MASVVLENVKASELPAAWRKRAKVKGDELITITIDKRAQTPAQRATRKPNATFGMWRDRTDLDPAAYVLARRQPRSASR